MTKTNTTTNNRFTELLRAFELSVIREGDPDSTVLYDLATACALGCVKKIYSASAQPTLRDLYYSIIRDRDTLRRLAYSTDRAYGMRYDDVGNAFTAVVDKSAHQTATKLSATALGDGLDLINTAVVALMSETEKAKERGDVTTAFLENPYTVRRLKGKVWIKTVDSVNGWETVETSPIREVYRAIRREISANSAVQVANNKYTYLSEIARDSESGEETEIYRRLPKYANLAGDVTDFNGAVMYQVADRETVDRYDEIISSLELTERQATVLRYRMSGHGYKAIATALGIQERLVKRTCKQIQIKMYDLGIKPDDVTERPTVK